MGGVLINDVVGGSEMVDVMDGGVKVKKEGKNLEGCCRLEKEKRGWLRVKGEKEF